MWKTGNIPKKSKIQLNRMFKQKIVNKTKQTDKTTTTTTTKPWLLDACSKIRGREMSTKRSYSGFRQNLKDL